MMEQIFVGTMKKTTYIPLALLLTAAASGILLIKSWHSDDAVPSVFATVAPGEQPYGIAARVPWTTSHLTGSPEPPPPYRIVRAFPKLTFKNPLLITNAPGTERLFVGEQAGKLYSFPNDQAVSRADPFLDLTTEIHSWDKESKVKGVGNVYGLTFHPQFARNRYCYVCYVLDSKNNGEQLPDGSRVSRFHVTDSDPPRCEPQSEKVLITWMAGGHNGGCLQFGPDGCLYISTGDAANPNPPDSHDTGQDISDLLSSILRIDVDHEEQGKPYAIPPDNPFVKTAGARPEVWAYGLRNPWRMSFDRATGDLWVGDVGWELWEMIYRVRRGGNYGWSVMEGPQPVRPNSKRGPTPILPPTLDFPHSEAASITGGYVYRGKSLPDLVGAYICGDWVTHRLWGTLFDGDRMVWHKELAQGNGRIVAFGEDNAGELYFLNYEDVGTISQLAVNEASREQRTPFPAKLSETGLFVSVKDHEPAPGVVPFSVNAVQWADHATAERLVALPGQTTARMYDNPIEIPGAFNSGQVFFPRDGVVARTISLEMESGNPKTNRRLETQILHFDGQAWRGYSYEWNDAQTDATLVPATGLDRRLTITDIDAPGGKRRQTWHFPSRSECLQCHNPWAGNCLAFTLAQLNKAHAYGAVTDNQLRTLQHAGIIALASSQEATDSQAAPAPPGKLANPYDAAADLNERARSYLHVNCSHCHQFGAGGTADIELRYQIPLEQTKTLEVHPVQGTFEIHDAQLLAPADPFRSILYYRMSKLGPGRMPHVGSQIVDEVGLRLMHDWIRQLPIRKDDRALIEVLRALDEPAVLSRERAEAPAQLNQAALALARAQGRENATLEEIQKAEIDLKAQTAARVQTRAAERTDAIKRLLANTSSALLLVHALDEKRIPASVRPQVLAAALTTTPSQVRDLFERFVPDEQHLQRLGTVIHSEEILGLKGDPVRGKELFFKTAGLQCINCHRVAGVGSTLGPDLTQIGQKYTRAQLLENIVEPSKTIDPKYVTYLVQTFDGQAHTGILVEKTVSALVLRTGGDKEIRIPTGQVETVIPQPKSLMPELLLRDLTAQQAADLLDFLASLK